MTGRTSIAAPHIAAAYHAARQHTFPQKHPQTSQSLMTKITPADVYVTHTGTAKGRGVFASRAFRAGEIVEVAPVVVIPKPTTSTTRDVKTPRIIETRGTVTEFDVLLFAWDQLAGVAGTAALALGYGSLYNSANPANLRYEAVPAETALRFTAVRDIEGNEELTINYNAIGGGAEWVDQNWFQRKGIPPVP